MSVRGYLAAIEIVIQQQQEEEAYRVYMSDSLRLLTSTKNPRYADWIKPKSNKPVDGTKIATSVIKDAGLVPIIRNGGEAK